nr:MAG TPA: hypothetical protein [Caudoviricetes sp.]
MKDIIFSLDRHWENHMLGMQEDSLNAMIG